MTEIKSLIISTETDRQTRKLWGELLEKRELVKELEKDNSKRQINYRNFR